MAAASSYTRHILSKSSVSSVKSAIIGPNKRTKSLLQVTANNSSLRASPSRTRSNTIFTASRFPSIFRNSLAELGGVQSLMPLHSTLAAARMISCLPLDSSNCRALSQGTLCRTSPGP